MSRLTFRDAVEVAWQKQLRDRYIAEGTPDVDLSLKKSVVRPISKQMAKQIIFKYEWLGTMAPTNRHFGIFFGEHLAGVTCVGGAACTAGTSQHLFYGVERDELLILARGANTHWSPVGANSKLVSWTCRLLANAKAGKIIIAYSDTDAGEIGTIYQACNWVYVGAGSSTEQWVSPIGRVYDAKYPDNLKKSQGNKHSRATYVKLLKEQGWTTQKSNPKHRYCYILDKNDKRLVDKIEAMRLPYPKRADG